MASRALPTKVTYGTGLKRQYGRVRYDFSRLQKINDYFKVEGKSNYGSLRSQASKQGKTRGVRYAVNKIPTGVMVTLVQYLD